MYERLLGPALPEMLEDAVPWEMVKHAGMTVFIWVGGDKAAAERFWSSSGGAQAPSRPAPRKGQSGTASKTRRVASTAGTSSPPDEPTAA